MATFRPRKRAGYEQRVHAVGNPQPVPARLTCLVVACGCCAGSGKLWREPDPEEGGAGMLLSCAVCGSSGWREVG